jgi:DNA-binding response OmpR family regulator
MARILVVDDDDQVRGVLRAMLEREGYEVDEAPDGRAAVARYKEQPADLVVLDMLMPEMEGVETMLTMRRLDAGVRIIAISGGGHLGPKIYLDSARKFGAHQTFAKPVDRDELLEGIRQLLDEDVT